MAFTGSSICTSFYTSALNGLFNFGTHVFKLALYTNSASFTSATTAYTTANELAASLGYTAGGAIIAATVTTTTTASGAPCVVVDFADATWATATFTARGGILYSDTSAGKLAVAILDFGANKTGSGGTFTVVMPSPTPNTALLTLQTILQAV